MAKNELVKVGSLKTALDEIDKQVMQKAAKGFYDSRLSILIGMWEKGRVISDSRGGKIGH